MSGAIVFLVAGLYACFLFYLAHWAKARDGSQLSKKSVEGRGSRFSVILPLKEGKTVKKSPSEPIIPLAIEEILPSQGGNQAPLKFLIVDNDKQVCDAMATLVQSLGYDTEIAYSGIGIVEKASKFDGVFLDYDLSEQENGIDLARRIIGEQKDAKIAIITAHSIASTIDIEAELGVRILKKPLDTKKLLNWLNINFSK